MPRNSATRDDLIEFILDTNSDQRSELAKLKTQNQNLTHDNTWLRQTLAQNNNLITEMRGTIQALQTTRLHIEREDSTRAQTHRLLDFILAAQDPSPEALRRRIEQLQSQHDLDQRTLSALRRNDSSGLRSEVVQLQEEINRLKDIIDDLHAREAQLRQDLTKERMRNDRPRVAFTTVNRSPSKKISSKR